ncbi:hypothetical protein D3C81_1851520 [compost metagenome]
MSVLVPEQAKHYHSIYLLFQASLHGLKKRVFGLRQLLYTLEMNFLKTNLLKLIRRLVALIVYLLLGINEKLK